MYTRFPRRCYLKHVIGASFECVEWRQCFGLGGRRPRSHHIVVVARGIIPLERNFLHSLSVVLSAEPGRK